jgi:hypothetical protein
MRCVLDHGIDLRLIAVRLELVAEHVEIARIVVIRVRRAVRAEEPVPGGDPGQKRWHVGDAQVPRRVREEHRIHAVQPIRRQHPSHIVRRAAEHDIVQAALVAQRLQRRLGDGNGAVAEAFGIRHHHHPRARTGRRRCRFRGRFRGVVRARPYRDEQRDDEGAGERDHVY